MSVSVRQTADFMRRRFVGLMVRDGAWRVLVWLPVVLLPLGNVAGLAFSSLDQVNMGNLAFLVAAALWEEILFRWLLLKHLLIWKAGLRPAVAAVGTGVLFGLFHLCNIWDGVNTGAVVLQVVCSMCFGVWAGAALVATDSITPCVLAHIMVNATSILTPLSLDVSLQVALCLPGSLLVLGLGLRLLAIDSRKEYSACSTI